MSDFLPYKKSSTVTPPSPKSPCCQTMQEKVLNNRYGYEDEKILIVHGKEDDNSLFFIFVDKERKDTMPLGSCIWCGADIK